MEQIAPDLRKTLDSDPAARAKWDDLTPLARRDFVSWIDSAKKAETRKRRVDSIPSRLASGKRRPCCYAVVPLELYSALNDNPDAKAKWQKLSPDGKRDFSDWVASAQGKQASVQRASQSALLIEAGKKPPRPD